MPHILFILNVLTSVLCSLNVLLVVLIMKIILESLARLAFYHNILNVIYQDNASSFMTRGLVLLLCIYFDTCFVMLFCSFLVP